MVAVYLTCPASHCPPAEFRLRAIQAARLADEAGCRGLLVYSDNSLADPWAAAMLMIGHTKNIAPMIAVNPMYMHPFSVARMISSIAFIHGRRVDLNFVTGGFSRHLSQIGSALDHDERYERLAEYIEIVDRLLTNTPMTYAGRHYQLNAAAVSPPMDQALAPTIFVSGSSDACRRLQRKLGVTRLHYPREASLYRGRAPLRGCGIRLGIIARDTSAQAWNVARTRFPPSRDGEDLHDWSAGQVESSWHHDLSRDALNTHEPQGAYWIYPFRAYHTFCPYLVGDFSEVSDQLAHYLKLGVSTFILDELSDPADLRHAMHVMDLARASKASLFEKTSHS